MDLTNYTISSHSNCLDALIKLDQEKSNQTLFVLNEHEKLIGTVTDGDIRRGLINGYNLRTSITFFSNKNFCYLTDTIDVSIVSELKKNGIKLLPKVNKEGIIERVYNLSQLRSILPVHAVLLAGGRGERLRPLTDNTPKSLLPLGEKPILEYNIDYLILFGIEKFTISVHYLSEQIINYFGNGQSKGVTIDYIEEEIPLGTIGCLESLKNHEPENFLVLNSDVFTNINYEDFYLAFKYSNADMAVASVPYSVDIPYAIMELQENRITSFIEKPKNSYYANAGIYLMNKHVLSMIPPKTYFNATDLMNKLLSNKGNLIHSPITGFWIDIGKPDDYKRANELIRHL